MKKILYGIAFGIWYLMSLLPLSVLYLVSDGLFYLVFYVVKYRRPLVKKHLADSFPEKSEAERLKIEKEFYSWFCDYIVESIKLLYYEQEASDEAHAVYRRGEDKRIVPKRTVVCHILRSLLQLGMGYFVATMGRRRYYIWTNLPRIGESSLRQTIPLSAQSPWRHKHSYG